MRLLIIAEEKKSKSVLSYMRSFVMVIRSAYLGAQKRRKYAKSVGYTGLKCSPMCLYSFTS